jgi:hypothetical protein
MTDDAELRFLRKFAKVRFHLGLFDTCPRIDTTRRIAPV